MHKAMIGSLQARTADGELTAAVQVACGETAYRSGATHRPRKPAPVADTDPSADRAPVVVHNHVNRKMALSR